MKCSVYSNKWASAIDRNDPWFQDRFYQHRRILWFAIHVSFKSISTSGAKMGYVVCVMHRAHRQGGKKNKGGKKYHWHLSFKTVLVHLRNVVHSHWQKVLWPAMLPRLVRGWGFGVAYPRKKWVVAPLFSTVQCGRQINTVACCSYDVWLHQSDLWI